MSTKFWRRLAGCIVIKCALAAAPDYRAGTAATGDVKAVALEDSRGHKAVFAESAFPITRATSDFVAAQLAKSYDLPRASVVLSSAGLRPATPEDLVTAIAAALGSLEPVKLTYNGTIVSITALDGKCLATIPEGPCAKGAPIRPPIRTAFQLVEPPHPLQQRGTLPPAYPVQAIALGKSVTILALSGDTQYPSAKALLVLHHANDTVTPPDPAAAIRAILARVRP